MSVDFDTLDGLAAPDAERLVERWRARYLAGEVEVAEFEEGVARALVGRADAATEEAAGRIAAKRREGAAWLALPFVQADIDRAVRRATQR